MSPPTFCVVTFGCQMNEHDSERIAGALLAAGYTEEARERADIVLFNTCCVREGAAERLRGQVASMARDKRARPELVIGILGCLAQAEGEALIEQLPHVDLVVGTHRVPELPVLLETLLQRGRPLVDTAEDLCGGLSVVDLPSRRRSTSAAWLAVMQGCDNHCSYCIVPAVRGPERSRPMEEVVREAEELLADGVVEITLLGQNVNSYGRDLYGRPRFAELLRRLDATGIRRLRFTTSHPRDLTDDVLAAMESCGSVCEHLHLPAQSGSDRILNLMGRGYTAQTYLDRVAAARRAVSGIAISTDLMVGFPSETESDFEETLSLVEEVGFSQAFTFVYSPRPHTPAATMADVPEPEITRSRMNRLVQAVNRKVLEWNLRLVGTTQEVLIDGPAKRGEGRLKGRSRGGQTVVVEAGTALPGQVAAVRIVEAHTWFLLGEVRSR